MPRITKKIYTFEDAIEDFMIHCTNKDLSKKTMKFYESTLKLFSKYLEDEANIFTPITVTTKHIKTYLEFTKNKGKYSYVAEVNSLDYNNPQNRGDFGKEVSMWTVNNYLRNIKVFFTWLTENKVIKENPSAPIKYYKHSCKPKSEIKDVDFNKIIKSLDLTLFAEYRDYVILQLLMDTGMRIGETLSLKVEDVIIDKKAIFIRAEICKGRKDRYVFFSTTMQTILKRWINHVERYFDSEYLFVITKVSTFTVTNFEKT